MFNQLTVRLVVTVASAMMVLIVAWSIRFETLDLMGIPFHRNRLTGVVCHVGQECWWSSDAPSALIGNDQ